MARQDRLFDQRMRDELARRRRNESLSSRRRRGPRSRFLVVDIDVAARRRGGARAQLDRCGPRPDRLFGTVLRMRDELRELEPGVLLGDWIHGGHRWDPEMGPSRIDCSARLQGDASGDDVEGREADVDGDDVLVDDAADSSGKSASLTNHGCGRGRAA